jgi:protein-tyrosine phosphatase
MGRPYGGDWLEDEVKQWKASGVDMVVSALTGPEVSELDLLNEGTLCAANGIVFRSFPIEDRSVPDSTSDYRDLVEGIADELSAGRSVAVHCRMGIGRTGLIAAGVLVRLGHDPESAFRMLSAARNIAMPDTPAQSQWLAEAMA